MDVTAVDASTVSYTALTQSIASSDTTWHQSDLGRFDIPGDSQYAFTPCQEVVTLRHTWAAPTSWFDDLELYSLSTAIQYDGQGRITSTLLPNGTGIKLVRDRWGRIVQLTDPRGNTATMAYDSLNRVIATTDPLEQHHHLHLGPSRPPLHLQADANGNETQYANDNLNRLVTITYPGFHHRSFYL